MKRILPLFIILLLLIGCASTIESKPIQTKIVDSPTETVDTQINLKADLQVIQTKIVKGSVDIQVIGQVKNRGNKNAESVTVRAACKALGSSTTNTGVDLIDVPAGVTTAYQVTIPIAPYKQVDCSVKLEY